MTKNMEEPDELVRSNDLSALPGKPRVVVRNDHRVSRKNIDADALKVMRRLSGFGYQAFLVGGGVRDLLLKKKPKDFDIGTSARPEDIRELFRNSRIIGRRFKLVHIYFKGGKIVEVATFRGRQDELSPELLAADNTFGDAESDALRRDLTINGLFYDAQSFSIIDYVKGLDDLEKGIVRMIGDPEVRFQEDPVRIIRAARHAARTGFKIHKKTATAMRDQVELLSQVPSSRLYEEVSKDFYSGDLLDTFEALKSFGAIEQLFPNLSLALNKKDKEFQKKFLGRFERLDGLINEGKDPLQELFFAALMIGLFDPSHLEEIANIGEETRRKLGVLTQSAEVFGDQILNEQGEEDPDKSEPPPEPVPELKLTPRSGNNRQRDRISSIARGVGAWFSPLVLTKREKASVERLLVLRRRLFEVNETTFEKMAAIISSLHEEERQHLEYLLYVVGDPLGDYQVSLLQGKTGKKAIKKPKEDRRSSPQRARKKKIPPANNKKSEEDGS